MNRRLKVFVFLKENRISIILPNNLLIETTSSVGMAALKLVFNFNETMQLYEHAKTYFQQNLNFPADEVRIDFNDIETRAI